MQHRQTLPGPHTTDYPNERSESSQHDSTVSLLTEREDKITDKMNMPVDVITNEGFFPGYLPAAICHSLHVFLALAHIVLLIMAAKDWEHKFVFSVEHQTAVSFWTTVITQGFGTVYASLLVFLTQRQAIQQALQSYQTLTTTHDSLSSWKGLGSALATLVTRISASASVIGTLNVVGYLGFETFNATVPLVAETFGIPDFPNSTAVNSTIAFMSAFPIQFLPYQGIFHNTSTPGLMNSTLHEVLQKTTSAKGQAQVLALGFDVACGYLNVDINQTKPFFGDLEIDFTLDSTEFVTLTSGSPAMQPNFLWVAQGSDMEPLLNKGVVISTTNIVLDSDGNQGLPVILANQPALIQETLRAYLNITQIQFLQCSKSVVPQSGSIDTQSNTLNFSSLVPNIVKSSSKWQEASGLDLGPQDTSLVGSNLWENMIRGNNEAFGKTPAEEPMLTTGVRYLMSALGLDPYTDKPSPEPVVLKLHDIENALSILIATLFWTGSHIQLDPLYMKYSAPSYSGGVTQPPVLPSGSTTVEQEIARVRLNSSILAKKSKEDVRAKGLGLLQSIWFWRYHPELSALMRDIKQPGDTALREAGLFPVNLWTIKQHQRKAPATQIDSLLVGEEKPTGTKPLHLICLLFHIFLVIISLALVWVATARIEHNVVFSIGNQQTVSFWCKTVATVFGTTYYTLLLYLTQMVSIKHTMGQYCTLTSTHDQVSAWTGLGSAVSVLCTQLKLPSSFLQISAISLYLATISVLHVTTPAIFSVESFTFPVPTTVNTMSIPQWPTTNHQSTIDFLQITGGFLPWIDNLDGAQKLGLSNGSLYDVVVASYLGSQMATVSATGFNISCSHISGVIATEKDIQSPRPSQPPYPAYNISVPKHNLHWLLRFYPGPDTVMIANIYTTEPAQLPSNSIILYTDNPVSDSQGNSKPTIALSKFNVSLQFLQCSLSLVSQTGEINLGTRNLNPNSLQPTVNKNHSIWKSSRPASNSIHSKSLVGGDYWAQILPRFDLGLSDVPLDQGSLYLMQNLGLEIVPNPPREKKVLYLHEIENAVASLVAATFWIGNSRANIPLSPITIVDEEDRTGKFHPPILSVGNVTISETFTAIRLDMSVLAASIGLGSSILLFILASILLAHKRGPKCCLDDLGFLQIVWVFEHHPELFELLEQVEDPTDYNLHAAGLVNVRVLDAVQPDHNFKTRPTKAPLASKGGLCCMLCFPAPGNKMW
ncbi:hypothetical protein C8R45DRAFT_1159470 [Mycena sanguinolenta]|nr:hypothetical protein C8R45DRAFT_1159470 [Mycena sanguinolenta]